MRSAARTLPLVAGAVPGVRGSAVYRGLTVRESAATPAAAVVRVWDGTAAGGGAPLLDVVSLTAGTSTHTSYPDGKYVTTGLFVEVVAGAVEGSVSIA